MAWSAPFTAVANATYTAAQHNASVRDNLLETAPAKATTPGSFFASTGTNTIAERITQSAVTPATETTTNTSYVDLSTVGPTVTATTGVRAFVFISAQLTGNTSTLGSFMSFEVSGATSVSATDTSALVYYVSSVNLPVQATRVIAQGLTAGSNQFRAKYKVAGATTGSFSQRNISVIPF